MKKALLTVAFSMLFTTSIFAQSEPTIYEGKQWAIHSECPSYCDIYLEQTTIDMIQGEVTFNGVSYQQVHSARNEDLSDLKPSAHYIREEGNIVYKYSPSENSERVIYDFNLSKGDRITKQYHSDILPVVFEVISVKDTILAGGDGLKRKCIFLDWIGFENDIWEERQDESNAFDIWVAGIGSLYSGIGEVHAGTTGGSRTNVLCCHNGSNPLFVNDKFKTCYRLVTTGIENNNAPQFNIIRNPIENKVLSIAMGENKFSQIDIYSMAGKHVFNKNIASHAASLNIPLNNLEVGSYVVILTKENGDRASDKIMIN